MPRYWASGIIRQQDRGGGRVVHEGLASTREGREREELTEERGRLSVKEREPAKRMGEKSRRKSVGGAGRGSQGVGRGLPSSSLLCIKYCWVEQTEV